MINVYHGDIISCDRQNSLYQYLVEENGRIAYVGGSLPDAYAGVGVTKVDGALMPSFVDTHIHLTSYAVFSATTDIKPAESHGEMLEMLLDYDRRENPKNILSFGASAHSVKEKRLMTREELDRAFASKPVSIICYDGHSSVNNTAMLNLYPKTVREARGFDAESGNITREAFYRAVDYVTGKVPLITLMGNMSAAFDRLAAFGVGMIHAAEGVGFPGDMDLALASAIARGQKSGFQTRVFFQTTDLNKAAKRKLPRSGGCFAAALDGCFGCCDAALTAPYEGQPNNSGILYRDSREVRDFIIASHRKGMQVSLHCIGDHVIDVFLGAVAAAQKDFPREDHRHTMIHAELLRPDQRERVLELGVPLARQPYFLDWNLEPPEYYRSILGSRADDLDPYKKELDMGIHIGGGSDAPVTNPEPIKSIHKLLNQSDPSKNITIEQALRMYTWNGAYISFDERERGSLETGKIADMIILDRNPVKARPEELKDIKVTDTILSGKLYQPGQRPASALLRGLLRQGGI
jgi:predicted amidohydrolase YtcJ